MVKLEEALALQSPWVSYTNYIREMFKWDPDIKMKWSDKKLTLDMYIANSDKAEAIRQILPETKTFGKITVFINIYPGNGVELTTSNDLIHDVKVLETALSGNPLFEQIFVYEHEWTSSPIQYVIFAKKIIQYYNDNLNDAHGNRTTLAEWIAREIFETEGIYYCTSNIDL